MTTRAKKEEVVTQANSLNIYQKLHLAKQSMGKVIKNATNPHLKRNYADINSIIDTVEPILLDHGLLLIQPIIDDKVCTCIVDVETGKKIYCYLQLPVITDAQKLGGAITYFRRYCLSAMLGLVTDKDTDASGEQTGKKLPTLTDERFENALKSIQDGKMTAEKLKTMFTLTEKQLSCL